MSHDLHTDIEPLPDKLDKSAKYFINFINDSIAHVRRADELLQEKLGAPTGYCMSCGAETMDPTARFCDFDCSADWQRAQDAAQRNGSGVVE